MNRFFACLCVCSLSLSCLFFAACTTPPKKRFLAIQTKAADIAPERNRDLFMEDLKKVTCVANALDSTLSKAEFTLLNDHLEQLIMATSLEVEQEVMNAMENPTSLHKAYFGALKACATP